MGTLLAIRAVVAAQRSLGLPEVVLAAVPVLFMYAPVWLCQWRGVDSDDYPLALPPIRDSVWAQALRWNLGIVSVILLPWIAGYHLYQTVGLCSVARGLGLPCVPHEYLGIWPSSILKLIGYHLFFVAIPEEFFYRGYLQSRLDEVLGRPWTVFGARLGWGWIATCAIFAAGHSIVQFQWWHFAIFFPSLAFGWLRARTGHAVAGALFHAWCNVGVAILDTLYGITPP